MTRPPPPKRGRVRVGAGQGGKRPVDPRRPRAARKRWNAMIVAQRSVCTGMVVWFSLFAVLLYNKQTIAQSQSTGMFVLFITALSIILSISVLSLSWWNERANKGRDCESQASNAASPDQDPVPSASGELSRVDEYGCACYEEGDAGNHARTFDDSSQRHRIDSALIWRQLSWLGVAGKGHALS